MFRSSSSHSCASNTPDAVLAFLQDLSRQPQDIRVLFNNENLGTTVGRNQGAALANGDWLIFLDNDVEVTAGWLDALLRYSSDSHIGACAPRLLSSRGNVLVAPPSLVIDEEDGRISKIGFRFDKLYSCDDPVVNRDCFVPWHPTTCLMVRRWLFEEIGGFDQGIFLAEEDKDLCLAIRRSGFKIGYVAQSSVYHAQLDKTPEYRAIRDNLVILKKDIEYFEKKWNCKVILECRRSYLRSLGMSEKAIDFKKRFDIFSTVIEDEPAPLARSERTK